MHLRITRTARAARVPFAVLTLAVTMLVASASLAAAAVPKGTLVAEPSCYFVNADGTYSVTADVTNNSTASVTIPIGGDNKFDPGADDQGQLATFAPGTNANAAVATFKATDWAKAKWHLNGVDYPLTTTTLCSTSTLPADGNPLAYLVFGGVALLVGGVAFGGRKVLRGQGSA